MKKIEIVGNICSKTGLSAQDVIKVLDTFIEEIDAQIVNSPELFTKITKAIIPE